MSTHASASCPICQRAAATSRAQNPFAPFCSPRCRTIDLGNWLGESYRVAAVEQDPSDDDARVPPRGEGHG